FHLVKLKKSHAGSVAVGRFHHSLGDEILNSKTLTPRQYLLSQSQRKAMRRTLVGRYISYLILAHIHGYRMIPGDNATPHKGKLSAKVGINKFIHRIISLDDVKAVKSAMNMTVNDIFLGIVQAGISRYLIILCTKLLSNIILITGLTIYIQSYVKKVIINLAVDVNVIYLTSSPF
ncbi:hypothetical protein HID58_024080, partial [Brassica napus]